MNAEQDYEEENDEEDYENNEEEEETDYWKETNKENPTKCDQCKKTLPKRKKAWHKLYATKQRFWRITMKPKQQLELNVCQECFNKLQNWLKQNERG